MSSYAGRLAAIADGLRGGDAKAAAAQAVEGRLAAKDQASCTVAVCGAEIPGVPMSDAVAAADAGRRVLCVKCGARLWAVAPLK